MDQEDWRVLLRHVLRQAIDDYIKLQHPRYRQKKYLQEAFQNAVDMFFDPDYRFGFIQNDEDTDMSLEDFLIDALDTQRVDTDKLRSYVAESAAEYWREKSMDTIFIPDMFCVEGHVYDVVHKPEGDYFFDYEAKELHINKKQESKNEQDFVLAMCEALCYHLDLRISKRNREEISKGLYRLLKVNNALRQPG